jgi:hypothetical protein
MESVGCLVRRILVTFELYRLSCSHNNLFHAMFYKIIQIIVRANHIESQQALLKQYRFLTKVIEHYRANDPTGKNY